MENTGGNFRCILLNTLDFMAATSAVPRQRSELGSEVPLVFTSGTSRRTSDSRSWTLLGSLVLNDIPVFDENPMLQSNDVRCNPVHRQSDVGEPAMNDDVVVFCKNHPRLIRERRRRGLDEVEEPVSSRLDMGAVLNVVGRPEPL